MSTHKVVLTEHFDRFIKECIASGQYANESELLQEALLLLEQRRREDALKLQRLREAVQVGLDELDRGEYIELSRDELHDYMMRKGEEAARRARKRDDAA